LYSKHFPDIVLAEESWVRAELGITQAQRRRLAAVAMRRHAGCGC
jgi:hypothetical protein